MHRFAACVVLVTACAADEDPPEPRPTRQLVDVMAWTHVVTDVPEFVPPAGMRIDCVPVDGYGPYPFGGFLVMEVNTGYCNWGTFEQPLLEDVAAGELVRPRLWHFELTSFEPAEGYAGVAIDGEVTWEYRVAIPSPSALAADGWITDVDIPAGTPVQFHVHNHGLNSWNLVEITAGPPDE